MPNTLIIKPARRTRRVTTRVFRGVLTGAYVLNAGAAGEVLNLTTATDPNYTNDGVRGIFDPAAATAKVYEAKLVRPPAGYTGEINLSTAAAPTWANAFILKLYSAAGVELAAAAYPAPILADSFEFEISGPNGTF
jgi:hypothetical protein